MAAAGSLGILATSVLNGASALAIGAALAGTWRDRFGPANDRAIGHRAAAGTSTGGLRRAIVAGLLLAACASAVLLWCEAAIMADVPLADAGASLSLVVTGTHYGLAWRMGLGALAAAGLLQFARPRWANWCTLALLACFLYTRSMVSHAASSGDFSVAIAADWLHLLCVCAWAGPVAVAGFLVLPDGAGAAPGAGAAFAQALSRTATVALGGIVATGLFNTWHNLGGAQQALGSDYAGLLFLKIVLVLVAAALGGVNRLYVLPALVAAQPGTPAAQRPLRTFTRILRIETALLLLVLLVAALLSSTMPPMAG